MIKAHFLALGAAALALAACDIAAYYASAAATASCAAAAVPPPAGKDWTQVVTITPEGGFLMGNPNAKVKLIEYLSLTCPHCKEFEEKGFPPLRDQYVKKGTVSLEVRNYVRDFVDMTATLVSRCGGADPYFPMTQQIMEQQNEIFEKLQNVPPAEQQRLQGLTPAEQFKAVASLIGIDQFAKQRGITQAKLDACLSDKAAVDKLVDMQQKANTMQIPGTPAFFLNGTMLQNVGTWEQLEPELQAAGA
jgi:protein-disulfide isomerase